MEDEKKWMGGGDCPPASAASSFGSLTVSPWSSTPYSDAVNRKRRRPHDDDHGANGANGGPGAAAARIKRPMNAFMVWSQTERRRLSADNPGLHNVEISRRLGQKWLQMREEERLPFMEEAERLRLLHLRQYPEYRYVPRKKGSARSNTPGKADDRRKPPATGEAGGVGAPPHPPHPLHHPHPPHRLQSDWTALGRFYRPEVSSGQDREDSLWLTNDCRAVSRTESQWLSQSTPFVFCPPPSSKSHGSIGLPPQWSDDERVSGAGVPPHPLAGEEEAIIWSDGRLSSRPVDPVLHRVNGPALCWSGPIWSGDHFVPDASSQHLWSQYSPLTNGHPSSASIAAGAQSGPWLPPAEEEVSGPLRPPPPSSSDCYLPSSVAQGTLVAADAVGFLADLSSGDLDDLRVKEEEEEDFHSLHSPSSDPFVSWLVEYYDVQKIESSA